MDQLIRCYYVSLTLKPLSLIYIETIAGNTGLYSVMSYSRLLNQPVS